jgi:hypothetical protein
VSGKAAGTPARVATTSAAASSKAAVASAKPAKLLPSASATAAKLLATPKPPVIRQAYNSMVNLAAFRNKQQGNGIWRDVLRTYPAARDLNPAVIQNRDWDGRYFYQFQVGTASAADSQVLCQTVKQIDLRCEVVRFP